MSTSTLSPFPIASGTSLRDLDQSEWLAARNFGVGASEAADICGFGYGSPLSVYLRKVGLVPKLVTSLAMRIGTLSEPLIRQLYEEETGATIDREQVFVYGGANAHPRMFATLDAIRSDGRIVEFKTVGHRSARDWGKGGDEVPQQYLLQATHQMLAAGVEAIDVAALLGTEFRVYSLALDEGIAHFLRVEVARFLDFLDREVKPPALVPKDGPLLPYLHPDAEGEIELVDDEAEDAVSFLDCLAAVKADTHLLKIARVRVEQAMHGARYAKLPDGRVLSRRVQHQAAGERVTKLAARTWSVITEKKAKGVVYGGGDDDDDDE